MKISINVKDLGSEIKLKEVNAQNKVLRKEIAEVTKSLNSLEKVKAAKQKSENALAEAVKENQSLTFTVDNLKTRANDLLKELV